MLKTTLPSLIDDNKVKKTNDESNGKMIKKSATNKEIEKMSKSKKFE